MAPRESSESLKFSEILKHWKDDSKHSHHHRHLEERPFSFSLQAVIEDLRNLDYSKVVWRNVVAFTLLHIYSVYGLFLVFTSCTWKTVLFSILLYYLGILGVTLGAHRVWSHRAVTANLPIRIFLAACQTMAFQNDIYVWVRDHRAHHKFSETDADPHNANRGFFFAHIGWLLYRKHPDVITRGKTIDVSDVLQDPVVRFQRKFYHPLVILCTFTLPAVTPWLFWKEDFITALMVAGFLRYSVNLHATWFVNSLAHWIGSKPYDRTVSPTENSFVSLLTIGEGWHNFHHVFPYDYRAAELGGLLNFNLTTIIIDQCVKYGWMWDRKTVSMKVLSNRSKKTGDGSRRT